MATNILMPALSPTMTEGTLSRWLKQEGDVVASGDVLAEIETDKATMEVEAVDEGVLGKILIAAGTEAVAINTPIAILVNDGEAVPDHAAPAAPPAASAEAVPPAAASKPEPASVPAPATGGPIVASPLARRLAREGGIDLAGIKGSGPNGRIVRSDLRQAAAAPVAKPQAAAIPAASPAATGGHRTIPNSSVRRVIARRLTEAKQTIPHFYVTIDVEMDAMLALRTQLNAASPPGDGAFKLSVNDMLIKACAVTLQRVPRVNASYTDAAILEYDDVDIAVAVSIPDGLITPIVRSAQTKSLAKISSEAKALIKRARDGKLKPDEFQGGGFSISNMGMFGVKQFAAIINPPQAAILAVAASEKRAVVRFGPDGDRLEIATIMSATLSVDHRVVDGALAAEWVSVFKSVVENPLSLVI